MVILANNREDAIPMAKGDFSGIATLDNQQACHTIYIPYVEGAH